jgi:hypothetical protein
MNADLEEQILLFVLFFESLHRFANAERSSNRPIRRWERRHYRVTDRPYDRATLGGDDLSEKTEMCANEIIGSQVANAFVESGGASEIGEQECETGDIELLINIERFGAVEIVESLVTQQALCSLERLTLSEEIVDRGPRNPHRGQYSEIGTILECKAQ